MNEASIISSLGFVGAVLGGYAYLPQILHLIREKCSAGISPRAYAIWTFSSALVLTNALYIRSPVFIFICSVQLISSAIILTFGIKNRNHACESHLHGKDPLEDSLL